MSLSAVKWIEIPFSGDRRGVLSVIEGSLLGIPIARVFYMHKVPPGIERGGHAHPHTDQVLVAVAGSMRIDAWDGETRQTFVLDDPNRALYLPKMTWTRLYAFSADSLILALCNTEYVPSDVIRDEPAFLSRLAEGRS